jgi:hypothetical protein
MAPAFDFQDVRVVHHRPRPSALAGDAREGKQRVRLRRGRGAGTQLAAALQDRGAKLLENRKLERGAALFRGEHPRLVLR